MKTKINFRKSVLPAILIIGTILFFSACAHSVDVSQCAITEPYGFWGGLIHGIIAPFSFFVSLFDKDTALYAVNNNGGWYDFGFVIGAGILFGGGCKAGRKRR
jgi:hypothetical protein